MDIPEWAAWTLKDLNSLRLKMKMHRRDNVFCPADISSYSPIKPLEEACCCC